MSVTYDVVVVGAGVVGCAIARQLASSTCRVAVLEAGKDVGTGTSKANTAILHTGFDAIPGSLESRLVTRGYELLAKYAAECGIALEQTGGLLVAWDEEQLAALPALAEKARCNGYLETELVDAARVYEEVPHLGPGARGGLLVPGESIIDPWSTTLAYANDAVAQGAELRRECRVTSVVVEPDVTVLGTTQGEVRTRWVVNAAGLGSDVVDAMFGHHRFTITPRRGEMIVFDKQARHLASRIVLPVPTSRGKGVIVTPTVFGNVMLGPTSEDVASISETGTSEAGLASLMAKGAQIMPVLLQEEVTSTYAGLRAATEHADYVIDLDEPGRYVCVGGVRSTGLTSSLAIAEHVEGLMRAAGLPGSCGPRSGQVPYLGVVLPRPHERQDLVQADPAYGEIVCFCERVTRGEIRDALASPVPPRDVAGLKRRTRALMGRCQGFYCGARVEALFDGEETS